MSQNKNELLVTRPADFRKTGHVLLIGQSDVLSKILLALHQKKYRREIEIGVFDFTSEQLLAKTSESMGDDNSLWSIEYHVTDVETARRALEELDLAFFARLDDPSLIGTWVVLVDGFAPDNWELFRHYLKEGKQARLYVIAASESGATAWLPDGTFDTVISQSEN